jgi:hypothetical protein
MIEGIVRLGSEGWLAGCFESHQHVVSAVVIGSGGSLGQQPVGTEHQYHQLLIFLQ